MQACKLSIGEASSSSQVVKAEIDVSSQRAAFLLADSSCLLFPSLSGNISPHLIPPPCTDICFLRLRERGAAFSSSSSEKSAETASRSDHKRLTNGKANEKLPIDGVDKVRSGANSNAMARVSSVGNAMVGLSSDETLLFVAVKPAKGCSGTDVTAWRFSSLQFKPAPICLENVRNYCPQFAQSPSHVARFEEIPHGSFVGISASINVVVLYSCAYGKLWILSAKCTSSEQDSNLNGRSDVVEECNKRTSGKTNASQYRNENPGFLHLIKCAVVDCNGPIYALHLSLQHLLVGQSDGVRCWNVRPLIKGRTVKKHDVKKESCYIVGDKCPNKYVAREIPEGLNCENKIFGTCRGLSDYGTATEGMANAKVSNQKGYKNGFSEVNVIGNGIMNLKLIPRTTGLCNDKGIMVLKSPGTDLADKPMEPFINNAHSEWQSNGSFLKKSGHFNALKVIASDSNIQQHEHINTHANGFLPSQFDQEEVQGQSKLSQCSLSSSSSTSSTSIPAFGSAHASAFAKGDEDGIFVPFESQMSSNGFVKRDQVASIYGVSEREFLILDSQGKLHLLNLHYSVRGDEVKMQRASQVSLNAYLQPLSCTMKIKMLAVLPVPRGGGNTCNDGRSRVLWVSDGGNTIHILKLPLRGAPKGVSGDSLLYPVSSPRVIQTVFTTDRVCSLTSFSCSAVMVQTEGSMLAYSLGES